MDFEYITYYYYRTSFGNLHAQYDYFMKLMDKLKASIKDDMGFWYNRDLILRNVANLTIVVDKKTEEIVAFYVIADPDPIGLRDIVIFQVFDEGKGIGRYLVSKLNYDNDDLVVKHMLPDTEGFWAKVMKRKKNASSESFFSIGLKN